MIHRKAPHLLVIRVIGDEFQRLAIRGEAAVSFHSFDRRKEHFEPEGIPPQFAASLRLWHVAFYDPKLFVGWQNEFEAGYMLKSELPCQLSEILLTGETILPHQ